MSLTNVQPLVTKTRLPRLPLDWMARPRLSDKLNEALRHKLVLLSAPAGYGKTTLVIEALRNSKKPNGWVSLDASDNIPGTFLTYFITALQNVVPAIGQPILNALQSSQPPPMDWLLTALINSISSLEDDFALVLDDYHTIESQAVHEAMSFIVEHLPPHAHLVITSRINPPLPLARWRVRGDLAEIRADELSFTTEEASAFFREVAGIALSEQDLATLESRTEGWIAGLKMAALSLRGKKDISGSIDTFSGSHHYVLDYLADEVLKRQSSDVKQFLLETSVLERLCGPLCDAVTERGDSQSMLVQLELANLFISPLDDERHWYRYHQLFATVLRNQLTKSEPERVNTILRRASVWYEKEGLIEEAIDHALLGSDAERAAQLLERAAPTMLGRNRAVALVEYSSRIPEPLIMDSPWLCVCFAWAALVANKQELLSRMLSRAIGALAESPDKLSPYSRANLQRIKGYTLSIQSFIAQSQEDIPRAIRLAEAANQELPGSDVDDLLARAVNSLNLAGYYQNTGQVAEVIPHLEDLISAGRRIDYYYAVLSAQGALAEIEMQRSRFDRVAAICNESIEQGTRWGGGYPLPGTAIAFVALGKLDYERNDLGSAADNFTRAIELGGAGFTWEPVLKGHLQMAKLAQAQGKLEVASEHIRRAENVGPFVFVPPEAHQIPACKAWLAWRQGNIAAASAWAQQQEIATPLFRLPEYRQEYAYLTLVRLKLGAGEYGGLPEHLNEFIGNAEQQGRSATVIEALVLTAVALDGLGQSAEAKEILNRALSLAEPAGYVRTFVDEGASMAGLLRRVAAGGKHADYASRLLRVMALQSPEQLARSGDHVTAPGLIEALSEREVEVLELIAAGKSNKEIASDLFLAIGTVKKHTNNIFGKLGAESRTQAVARARELGII